MAYISNARPMPFNSTRTRATFDFSFARAKVGSNNATKMPMMAMTTSSSIKENAHSFRAVAYLAVQNSGDDHCTR